MKKLSFIFVLFLFVGCKETITSPAPEPEFKEYVAILSQSDTLAPVAIIIHNTLDGIPSYSRYGAGMYFLTLQSAFPKNKTSVSIDTHAASDFGNTSILYSFSTDPYSNLIVIWTYLHEILNDNILNGITITIKIYN